MKQNLSETLSFHYTLEERVAGKNLAVTGRFGLADVLNGNGRVYTRGLWEKVLGHPKVQENLKNRRMLGELDHPESGKTSLSRVSHVITDLRLKEDGEVWGRVEVLPTPAGKILEALLMGGIEPGISSRGQGSVREDTFNGQQAEIVEDDYDFKTFDFVSDPSTPGAFPRAIRENQDKNPSHKVRPRVDAINEIRFLNEQVNLLRSTIKPGANVSQIESSLLDYDNRLSEAVAGNPTAEATAKSVRDKIDETRKQLAKVNENAGGDGPSVDARFQAAFQRMISNLREANGKIKGMEEDERLEAKAVTDALMTTLRGFPLKEFFEQWAEESGFVMNESETPGGGGAMTEALEHMTEENQRLISENVALREQYNAAYTLAEALVVAGRENIKEMYVESLVRDRADREVLVPILNEANTLPEVAQRFRLLAAPQARRDYLEESGRFDNTTTQYNIMEHTDRAVAAGVDPEAAQEVGVAGFLLGTGRVGAE